MLIPDEYQRIFDNLPILHRADSQLLREFQNQAFYARIPAGKDVFVEGDEAQAIVLLIAGVVRVYKIGETGREITLYRFGHGESCILTSNAILSWKSFPAVAMVEADAEAVMIPAEAFRDWIKRYDLWRDFVLICSPIDLQQSSRWWTKWFFQRMDRRVASLLLTRSRSQHPLRVMHQEIAAELGSSREVISPILEDISQEGLVESGRGMIKILDVDGLSSRAAV